MSKPHTKTFIVICRGPKRLRRVKVQAQYFRPCENGGIVFRNFVPNSYPQTVRLFAGGHWLEVIGE